MIEKIGIIGGGKMGTDIFYFLADFQFPLTWVFRSREKMLIARELWIKKLQRIQKFSKLAENTLHEKLNRIRFTNDLSLLTDCDLIIESIVEDFEAKSNLFVELDSIAKSETIFATNTSSIPVESLAPSDVRRERFLGLHFFYPVKIKNLVEVNILPETSQLTLVEVSDLLKSTGKYYKVLNLPNHFLFNRLFLRLQAGVYNLHKEKKIPAETIDLLIKEKLLPIGIFEFFDQVGIDVMGTAINNYTVGKPDSELYQPLIHGLKNLIAKNYLGLKTGKGFYDYSNYKLISNSNSEYLPDPATLIEITRKIYEWYLTPLFETVANHLLTEKEIELILSEYMGTNRSPFELAKEIGFNPQ